MCGHFLLVPTRILSERKKYPSWYKWKVTKHDINNSDETGDHKDVKSVKSRPCDVKYKRENPSSFH